MKTRKLALTCQRRGAAAIEMAMITPIFLMLVFGIIELGRGMMARNMITHAAREGARMAVLDGVTNADVTSSIQAFMNSALGVSASNVTVAIATVPATGHPDPGNVVANCQSGDLITVNVHVPFNSVALIPGNYLAGQQLTGRCAMRRE